MEKYICKKCNTVIASSVCEIKKEKYYYTLINNYNMNSVNNIGMEDMPVSFKMHYRNITDITESGDVVCPICNKVHKK